MQNPSYLSTVTLQLDEYLKQSITSLKKNLHDIPGVSEIAVLAQENLIYLKIDKKIITEEELRKRIRQSNPDAGRDH